MNPTPDEQQNFNSIFAKLAKLPTANLEVDAVHGFLVVCYIQLACGHPEAPKDTNKRMEIFARTIQSALASRLPEVDPLLEQGWHREYDVPQVEAKQEPIAYYSHLPENYQVEIVANSIALHLACRVLARIGGNPEEEVFSSICAQANEVVNGMSEADVFHVIATMDLTHNSVEPIDDDHDNN
ncbi:MAG TPA: hypothetical protein V6C95_12515 [Coleofasciculaceae cyanobacterium]